jgi:hypothetical protein
MSKLKTCEVFILPIIIITIIIIIIIRVIKLKRIRWVGHVARMRHRRGV